MRYSFEIYTVVCKISIPVNLNKLKNQKYIYICRYRQLHYVSLSLVRLD